MSNRTAAEVERDAAGRRAGIRVAPAGANAQQKPARKVTPSSRSTAQSDKDIHIRRLGGKAGGVGEANRARSNGALGGIKGTKGQRRDRIGRFA
jgi:hypothetical protein